MLVDEGYAVAALARSTEFVDTLAGDETGISGYTCDVTDAAAVGSAFEAVRASLGAPTVLIYNAARFDMGPFESLTAARLESCWRVACLGAFHCAQAILPDLQAAGGGTILFTGATASLRGGARFGAFASAKAALRNLAQSMARELGAEGVHVGHVIVDGIIWSETTRKMFDPGDASRCMQPDDIAEAYRMLLRQPRSAWTFELDLRPSTEKW
jgi:NAD(P)-dependent dehydrogenase (short-subunit alcohol dehydrogenase family)